MDGVGLGIERPEELTKQDAEDEFESYRKRMMLAYRFRPNPLVNDNFILAIKANILGLIFISILMLFIWLEQNPTWEDLGVPPSGLFRP